MLKVIEETILILCAMDHMHWTNDCNLAVTNEMMMLPKLDVDACVYMYAFIYAFFFLI